MLPYFSAIAAGVFLGAGLLHLLPDAQENFAIAVSDSEFPHALLVAGIAFLLTWALADLESSIGNAGGSSTKAELLAVATQAHTDHVAASICYVAVAPVTTYTPLGATVPGGAHGRPRPSRSATTGDLGDALLASQLQAVAGAHARAHVHDEDRGHHHQHRHHQHQHDTSDPRPVPSTHGGSDGDDGEAPAPVAGSLTYAVVPVPDGPGSTSQRARAAVARHGLAGHGGPARDAAVAFPPRAASAPRAAKPLPSAGIAVHSCSGAGHGHGGARLHEYGSLACASPDMGKRRRGGVADGEEDVERGDGGATPPPSGLHGHEHGDVRHRHVTLGGSVLLPFLLAMAFSVHSVTAGLALGIQPTVNDSAISVLIAILAHKSFEAATVSVSFLSHDVAMSRAIPVLASYVLMTPFGIAAGWVMQRTLEDSKESAAMAQAIVEAAAAGTFIFMTVHEYLGAHGHNEGPPLGSLMRTALASFGFAFMALVAIWA